MADRALAYGLARVKRRRPRRKKAEPGEILTDFGAVPIHGARDAFWASATKPCGALDSPWATKGWMVRPPSPGGMLYAPDALSLEGRALIKLGDYVRGWAEEAWMAGQEWKIRAGLSFQSIATKAQA